MNLSCKYPSILCFIKIEGPFLLGYKIIPKSSTADDILRRDTLQSQVSGGKTLATLSRKTTIHGCGKTIQAGKRQVRKRVFLETMGNSAIFSYFTSSGWGVESIILNAKNGTIFLFKSLIAKHLPWSGSGSQLPFPYLPCPELTSISA